MRNRGHLDAQEEADAKKKEAEAQESDAKK